MILASKIESTLNFKIIPNGTKLRSSWFSEHPLVQASNLYLQMFLLCLQKSNTLRCLPVERAKDAVCFLQWCGVSLVSSYGVWFLQQGGVSLASSAIIYNIVKVKVTCWPVDPLSRLTRWPVDLLTFSKKNPSKQLRGPPTYTVEMWPVWPVDPSTRWPIIPLTF